MRRADGPLGTDGKRRTVRRLPLSRLTGVFHPLPRRDDGFVNRANPSLQLLVAQMIQERGELSPGLDTMLQQVVPSDYGRRVPLVNRSRQLFAAPGEPRVAIRQN